MSMGAELVAMRFHRCLHAGLPLRGARREHRNRRPDRQTRRPENDDRRTQVLVALADEQVRFVQQPDRPRLRRHVVGGHTVQPDGDSSRLPPLARARDLAEPMDHRLAIVLRHRDQMAGVALAVDFVDVGERRHVVSVIEAAHRVGQRSDQQPTGLQALQRAAQKRRTPGVLRTVAASASAPG